MKQTSGIIKDFENFLIAEGDQLSTIQTYLCDVTQLSTFLTMQHKELVSASIDDLRKYVHAIYDTGLMAASINRKISSMRSFYRFLIFAKKIEANPATDLELMKVGRKLPVILSIAEITEIIEAAKEKTPLVLRDRACLEILYGAGLRISELLGVRIADLDLVNHLVKVVGKGNRQRIVPFGKKAAKSIENYLANGRPGLVRNRIVPFLVLNARGKKMSRME